MASANYAWAVNAKSDDAVKQSTQDFLDWLATPEQAAAYADLAGYVPITGETAADLAPIRERLARQGMPIDGVSDELLKAGIQQRMDDFRDKAPLSAAAAATLILDGVREERWRILVGDDADMLDRLVRESPEDAYEPAFFEKMQAAGFLGGVDFDEV